MDTKTADDRLPYFLNGDVVSLASSGTHHLTARQIHNLHQQQNVGQAYEKWHDVLSVDSNLLLLGAIENLTSKIVGYLEDQERKSDYRLDVKWFENWLFTAQLRHGPCPKKLKRWLEEHLTYGKPNVMRHLKAKKGKQYAGLVQEAEAWFKSKRK